MRRSSKVMSGTKLAPLVLSLLLGAAAAGHDYEKGDLFVDHPWMPVTASGQEANVYLSIENRGEATDRLLAASTPRARAVELREGSRRLESGIELAAGSKLALEGGPYRLVLIGPGTPLSAGQHFPLVLRFERAGEIEAMIHVEPRRPAEGSP